MKKKISILGCGWLGLALVTSLVKNGFIVKGSTRSTQNFEKLKAAGITPYLIELSKINNCDINFFDVEVLVILTTNKRLDDFKELISVIESTRLKKILFISSTSVYDNENKVVTEKTAVNNSYLSEIEKLFIDNKNFASTIIRFGGLFGYDRQPGKFYPPGKVIDNPEGYINFIHRDDCVQILEQIILKDLWGEIFNACADSHPKRKDFFTNEAIKLGRKAPEFNDNSSNNFKIVNSDKLKNVLNYNFKYPDLLNY